MKKVWLVAGAIVVSVVVVWRGVRGDSPVAENQPNICHHNRNITFDAALNPSVVYIFAPGSGASETQIVKYIPSFIASTGELIQSDRGINVLGCPLAAVNFAEINLQKNRPARFAPDELYRKINYFFVAKAHERYGVTISGDSSNGLSLRGHWVNLARYNLGQEADIEKLDRVYDLAVHKTGHDLQSRVVLYGVSRGAATVFDFIALKQPKDVVAAVVEGIYDDVNNVLNFRFSTISRKVMYGVLKGLTSWQKAGISPISLVDKIPQSLPLLFITSRADRSVPSTSTLNLYRALRATGHKAAHLLILERSAHPRYMLDDADDRATYQEVVHAFYKHYNLPHNTALAEKGWAKFLTTQPEISNVR